MKRPCPVTGCGANIARDKNMCRKHWYMVPYILRLEVNSAWGQYKQAQGRDRRTAIQGLRSAQDAALKAVEDKLKQ